MKEIKLKTKNNGLIVIIEKRDPKTGEVEYGSVELESSEEDPFVFKAKENTWTPLNKDEKERIVNG